uniref:Predicted nucleic acid-binding protein, contains PIN domain n=1 Tax=Candidatus Kentrum sp. FM TaxID=2126340 RepID=A0A450SWB0_9GAMM|nr:MAG: Predicted nucleic acid-binding protein, contains PIN domain [Candidatus Kentron sp. FM]VFJ58550.1 MAG: Predicted nucleic acid-binding protein, contains PIN domain [Candidatus Kentron sp. FM]VFK11555.1 MAG: Predicted nucleic acid-binding protein, contains PIN domain [Candidatus Kentron sp. FM]
MGALNLPGYGAIYLDTNCFIYSVERIEPYCSILEPVWQRGGIITSDLTLLEVLVKPFRRGDRFLQQLYGELLNAEQVERVPLSPVLLERAASLRAATGIKTPDAIHAACALAHRAVLFISNDKRLQCIPELPFAYLNDCLS